MYPWSYLPQQSTTSASSTELSTTKDTYDDIDYKARALYTMKWMIGKDDLDEFYNKYWEQQPLLIQRPEQRDYYTKLLSLKDIKSLIETGKLVFSDDIDVTQYIDGKRKTLNEQGTASVHTTWDKFEQDGCSLRLVCPQAHVDSLFDLLSILEDHFNMFTGANTYLTPAGTQGFAPHWDDIEAFILQVEGSKHWRVYAPRSKEETLPRFSSGNFSQDEIGEPIIDVLLQPGDMLYVPRGFIHQAKADPDQYSLHVTVSTAMQYSWYDFFSHMLPAALQMASAEELDFRRSVPRNLTNCMGIMHVQDDEMSDSSMEPTIHHTSSAASTNQSSASASLSNISSNMLFPQTNGPSRATMRETLIQEAQKKLLVLQECMNFDIAADQMARTFLYERLPPRLSACTIAFGSELADFLLHSIIPQSYVKAAEQQLQETETKNELHCSPDPQFSESYQRSRMLLDMLLDETEAVDNVANWLQMKDDNQTSICIRLAHPTCARIILNEEDGAVVYHPMNNSRRYKSNEEGALAIPTNAAPAIEQLVKQFPEWQSIEDLPFITEEEPLEGEDNEIAIADAKQEVAISIAQLIMVGAVVAKF